jgi:hypothetical protein
MRVDVDSFLKFETLNLRLYKDLFIRFQDHIALNALGGSHSGYLLDPEIQSRHAGCLHPRIHICYGPLLLKKFLSGKA